MLASVLCQQGLSGHPIDLKKVRRCPTMQCRGGPGQNLLASCNISLLLINEYTKDCSLNNGRLFFTFTL